MAAGLAAPVAFVNFASPCLRLNPSDGDIPRVRHDSSRNFGCVRRFTSSVTVAGHPLASGSAGFVHGVIRPRASRVAPTKTANCDRQARFAFLHGTFVWLDFLARACPLRRGGSSSYVSPKAARKFGTALGAVH